MSTADLVVIGAGPAGCAAAIVAARAGARVVLLEARTWPRGKVCGNCIAPDGIDRLGALGVAARALPGATALTSLAVHAGRLRTELPLTPGGVAVARDVLDAAMVDHAHAAGATFCATWRVGAIEPDGERVCVRRADSSDTVTASRAVLAGGLARAIPGTPAELLPRVRAASRMGVGVTTDAPGIDLPRGQIAMHVHRAGYVGLVRLADERVTIAAAVRPSFVRASGSVGAAIAAIIGDPRGPWAELDWTGTPKLTHASRRIADGPIAVAGDARAFVEPFTGEGIAWALASGAAAGAWAVGQPEAHAVERHLAARRRRCRVTALALRAPVLVRAGISLTRLMPGLADRVVRGRAVRAGAPISAHVQGAGA